MEKQEVKEVAVSFNSETFLMLTIFVGAISCNTCTMNDKLDQLNNSIKMMNEKETKQE